MSFVLLEEYCIIVLLRAETELYFSNVVYFVLSFFSGVGC